MNEQQFKLFQEGRIDDLVSILEKELESNPNDSEIKTDLGLAYHYGGRYNDAIRVYEKLLEIDPNDPHVLVNVGLDYHMVRNNDKAIQTFKKVIEQAKTKTVESLLLSLAHTNLGVVYEAITRFEDAVREYKTAISTDSSNHLAPKYLEQLKEMGDTDYGLLRARVLPDGTRRPELWYYHDVD